MDSDPTFLLRIADLTIALTSEDPALAVPPEGAMRQFLVREADPDEAEPDLRLQARWGKLEAVSSGEHLFDSGGLWRLVAANGSLRFSFTSPALGPLPYKMASADRAPLAGIYLLRHGHGMSNALVPQRRSQAITRLLASSFAPLYSRDALAFTLGFLDQVVRAVPCHELSFTPDERVVALVRGS